MGGAPSTSESRPVSSASNAPGYNPDTETKLKETTAPKVDYAKTPQELLEGKPRCKSCCACPETRKLRDECVAEKGIDSCQEFIDAHNKCMTDMGFNMGTKPPCEEKK